MTKLKTLAAAMALLASGLASATTTYNAGAYSVTYDETTTLGWISSSYWSGSSYGFEWSLPTSVSLAHNGGPASSASFALPSFTLTANSGYTLSGNLLGSLGNIVYTEFNGPTSISSNATVSVNGGPDAVLPTAWLTKSPTNAFSGYFSGTAAPLPLAGVSSVEVKNAWISLSASADSFATITGQPQNKLKFDFSATPVPEPESYALLLAGLAAVGLITRRRKSR